MRGELHLRRRWHVDLVATHALTRDGATWRLAWSSPVATDGFDGAHTLLRLPRRARRAPAHRRRHRRRRRGRGRHAAPRARRGIASSSCAPTSRAASRRCGRCASIRAPSATCDPRLGRRPTRRAPAEPDRVREASSPSVSRALALLFALCVARKARVVRRACARAGGDLARAPAAPRRGPRAALAGSRWRRASRWSSRARTAGAALHRARNAGRAPSRPRVSPRRARPGPMARAAARGGLRPAPSTWTADALAASSFSPAVAARRRRRPALQSGGALARRARRERARAPLRDRAPLAAPARRRAHGRPVARARLPQAPRRPGAPRAPWARVPLEAEHPRRAAPARPAARRHARVPRHRARPRLEPHPGRLVALARGPRPRRSRAAPPRPASPKSCRPRASSRAAAPTSASFACSRTPRRAPPPPPSPGLSARHSPTAASVARDPGEGLVGPERRKPRPRLAPAAAPAKAAA